MNLLTSPSSSPDDRRENLLEFAATWHGRDRPAGAAWAETAVGVMRLGGGERLLEWLAKQADGVPLGAEVQAAFAELRGFVSRMDYLS